MGLAGQGSAFGVGELADLGVVLGKQVGAMEEEWGCQVDGGCLL